MDEGKQRGAAKRSKGFKGNITLSGLKVVKERR
jgi:hypothetical protein